MQIWSLPAPRWWLFWVWTKNRRPVNRLHGIEELAEHLAARSLTSSLFSLPGFGIPNFLLLLWPFMFSTLPFYATIKKQKKTKNQPLPTNKTNYLFSCSWNKRCSEKFQEVTKDKGTKNRPGIISLLYFFTSSFLLRTNRKVEYKKLLEGFKSTP